MFIEENDPLAGRGEGGGGEGSRRKKIRDRSILKVEKKVYEKIEG